MKKNKKKYDAVAEVRKIRDELSVKYWNNPELLSRDLKEASDWYHNKVKVRAAHK
ncbi:MAG TPA: hypothetical protein VM802_30305 [Chitinophaga sp.]|uniref:hypothetical protein n=1 Tax=Chitinophaga sp. TaxID=1869181 RepID=UPI002C7AEE58|nr:hypothetical protein [Chitinophaga sp.]HVI49199.1 hypothetical protein [Chitinophaga sp.]